jgi:hypothetical protein
MYMHDTNCAYRLYLLGDQGKLWDEVQRRADCFQDALYGVAVGLAGEVLEGSETVEATALALVLNRAHVARQNNGRKKGDAERS